MQRSWLSAIVAFGLATGFANGAAGAADLPAADVREMEQLLAQLNFDPGAIDGEVDDRTRTAIRLYQEFAVLPVDGEPNANLLRELRQVSQVYAEMREATPPATEVAPPADEVAAAETVPDSAPPSTPEPEIAERLEPDTTTPGAAPAVAGLPQAAPEPIPEPDTAESVEPPREPAPEGAETDPVSAKETPTEPAREPDMAEPTEPASDSDVAKPLAPPAEPEPESEPEPAVAESVEPQPEAAPEAAAPPVAPKAAAGFNLAGMIARLKQRDDGAAPAASAQTARAAPAAPAAAMDRASYERTLIWNVQRELRRIGIDPGAADGNMRTRTTGAIETYQRARGLPADGRVSEELLARLQVEAAPPKPDASRPQDDTAPLDSIAPQAAGIDLVPSNGYQAFGAGYGAAQAGDYGAAVKLYDQAIDGGDLSLEHLAAAFYNRANAYQYLGVLDKAIEDYGAAIANKPGFPAAYYNRGFALDVTGEKVRAVEDFRKARDLGLQRLGVRSPDLPPPLP